MEDGPLCLSPVPRSEQGEVILDDYIIKWTSSYLARDRNTMGVIMLCKHKEEEEYLVWVHMKEHLPHTEAALRIYVYMNLGNVSRQHDHWMVPEFHARQSSDAPTVVPRDGVALVVLHHQSVAAHQEATKGSKGKIMAFVFRFCLVVFLILWFNWI